MDLKVIGNKEFNGKEIKVIEGGFGENCRVLTDRQISEIHDMEAYEVRKSMNRLIEKNRLKVDVDYIDLKSISKVFTDEEKVQFGYNNNVWSKSSNVFILSERGYSKLIKSMDDDLSWEVHDKLIDEYLTMRKIINSDEQLLAKLVLDIYNGGQSAVLSAKQLTEIEVNKATKPLLVALLTSSIVTAYYLS